MDRPPRIIQGGMGVAISGWRLAQTVSRLGHLGVVAGTALEQVLARRLQDGDPGGHCRRAFDAFPFRDMAERVWSRYYIAGGKAPDAPYIRSPFHGLECPRPLAEDCLLGNFVEVFLAREGHSNPVGINYLEKIQTPHLISIYGAMLAGVGYILMGAGIPLKIPGVLDAYVEHQPASYPLYVAGAQEGDDTTMHFRPRDFMEGDLPPLERPRFLPIIASNVLAATLLKKANGKVDGFIVEGPTAGGHNAPPRGKLTLNERGEPVYGERDRVNLATMRGLGVPFWLAGGYGGPGVLRAALEEGAAGVQVGTAFAYCEESGLRDDYKQAVLRRVAAGESLVPRTRSPRRPAFHSRSSSSRARRQTTRCTARGLACATSAICGKPTARPTAESTSDVPRNRSRSGSPRGATRRTRPAGSASATRLSPRPVPRRCASRAGSSRPASSRPVTTSTGSAASCARARRATRPPM